MQVNLEGQPPKRGGVVSLTGGHNEGPVWHGEEITTIERGCTLVDDVEQDAERLGLRHDRQAQRRQEVHPLAVSHLPKRGIKKGVMNKDRG